MRPGDSIGTHRILDKLGEGGMGEVYRATDTRLKRDVAIKVLPAAFTADPERLARFEREAQLLAQLHHPNIASIFGLEEADGVRALVMELVEGPTLADRLEQGRLPVDESLAIARQIAEALEDAHERGIVHRDLKPQNIKAATDGKVKVLDFGLAKAMDPTAGSAASAADLARSPTMMHSPTLTAAHGTQLGVILGTAAYMAPEQARGGAVDKRADIWAFGVVLYEMLTGRQLFAGDTVSDTLAAVLRADVDWTALPAATPPAIRRLLRRCLERNPKNRLRDIGDARLVLEDPGEPAGTAAPRPPGALRRGLPWGLAAAAALMAAWALWGRPGPDAPARNVIHLDIGTPPDVEPMSRGAISPGGRSVAMVGVKNGVRRLFVRHLDRGEAFEVPGTHGANDVVFSPDSGSVGIVAGDGTVVRLTLADQQRRVVASGADINGGVAWGATGIVFARDGALWVVPPDGGTPRALTVLDAARHEVMHARPLLLPGGLVLFSSLTTEPGTERIEAVSIDGGTRSVVVERATTGEWSPTGHVLFARDGAVLAAAIDPRTGALRGAAIPVMPRGAVESSGRGGLGLSLSQTGTLLYLPAGFTDTRVVSVARDGAALALDLPAGRYANPRVSPDGRRLVFESDTSVMETFDFARGTRARLTPVAFGTNFATWTADGSRVVFRRFQTMFWARADGGGESALPNGTVNDFPSSPGPDPDSVLVVRVRPETSGDVFLVSISGAFEPKPLVETPAYEGGAQLSPDGRFLLYQSNASGQSEVYVRPYPALDRQWQVSEGGGVQARWSRDSREIYYRSGGHLVSVSVRTTAPEPVFGKPAALFADEYDFGTGITNPNYDVTPDGRFVMLRRGSNGGKMRAVVHWTEELTRILAAGGVR